MTNSYMNNYRAIQTAIWLGPVAPHTPFSISLMSGWCTDVAVRHTIPPPLPSNHHQRIITFNTSTKQLIYHAMPHHMGFLKYMTHIGGEGVFRILRSYRNKFMGRRVLWEVELCIQISKTSFNIRVSVHH